MSNSTLAGFVEQRCGGDGIFGNASAVGVEQAAVGAGMCNAASTGLLKQLRRFRNILRYTSTVRVHHAEVGAAVGGATLAHLVE